MTENSPLRPVTQPQWMMPAISNFGQSPYPDCESWYSNRKLHANSLEELQKILYDGYIQELSGKLVGDYVTVDAGGITIPVETTEEIVNDGKTEFPSKAFFLSGGIDAFNADFHHHLVIRGGAFKMEFRHEIDAPATLYGGAYQHWRLMTMLNLCIFKNLHGVTFFNTAFIISGSIFFNDESERHNAMGNNAPQICTVNSENTSIFHYCSGLSFISASANISIKTENV